MDKPPGLASQPTSDPRRDHLVAAVGRFLVARDRLAEPPYLSLHHRLDRDTTGVVVLARTRRANPGLAHEFAEHRVRKTYEALAHRLDPDAPPNPTWEVTNRLRAVKTGGKETRVRVVESGGDLAETSFRLIEAFERAIRVEAFPRTGRTHQIRVHLAGSGYPVLGDSHYGAPADPAAPRTMLHAAALVLRHPVRGVELEIESPLPADYQAVLAALG